jgi:hypothetical protein
VRTKAELLHAAVVGDDAAGVAQHVLLAQLRTLSIVCCGRLLSECHPTPGSAQSLDNS